MSVIQARYALKGGRIVSTVVQAFGVIEIPTPPPAPEPPMPPAAVSVTPNHLVNVVVWSSVPDADSYVVLRATVSGGPYSEVSSNSVFTSFADYDVVAGTEYFYVIRSVSEAGVSSNSIQVSATPLNLLPGSFTFSVSSGLEELNINLDSESADADNYDIKVGDVESTAVLVDTINAADFPFTDYGVQGGVPFKYWVYAKNSYGVTPSASNPQIGTPGFVVLDPPGVFSFSVESLVGSVLITVDPASEGATGYKLYRGEDLISDTLVIGDFPYSDTAGTEGVAYDYTLFSYNNDGQTDASGNPISGTKLATPVVPGPFTFSVQEVVEEVIISLDSQSFGALTYKITRDGSLLIDDLVLADFPYSDTTGTVNVSYNYNVIAINVTELASTNGPVAATAQPSPAAVGPYYWDADISKIDLYSSTTSIEKWRSNLNDSVYFSGASSSATCTYAAGTSSVDASATRSMACTLPTPIDAPWTASFLFWYPASAVNGSNAFGFGDSEIVLDNTAGADSFIWGGQTGVGQFTSIPGTALVDTWVQLTVVAEARSISFSVNRGTPVVDSDMTADVDPISVLSINRDVTGRYQAPSSIKMSRIAVSAGALTGAELDALEDFVESGGGAQPPDPPPPPPPPVDVTVAATYKPGHWVRVTDDLERGSDGIAKLNRIFSRDLTNITGILIETTWGRVESARGVYTFSRFDTLISMCKARGKYVLFRMLDRTQWKTVNSDFVPSYVPKYAITQQPGGFDSSKWAVSPIWEQTTMNDNIRVHKAIAERYNSEPYFLGFYIIQEVCIRADQLDTDAKTLTLLFPQENRRNVELNAAYPRMIIIVGINWPPARDNSNFDIFVNQLVGMNTSGGGGGGLSIPDPRNPQPTTWVWFDILRANKNRLLIAPSMEITYHSGNWDITYWTNLLNYMRTSLGAHAIFWDDWNAGGPTGGDFYRDVVLPVINANPTVTTAGSPWPTPAPPPPSETSVYNDDFNNGTILKSIWARHHSSTEQFAVGGGIGMATASATTERVEVQANGYLFDLESTYRIKWSIYCHTSTAAPSWGPLVTQCHATPGVGLDWSIATGRNPFSLVWRHTEQRLDLHCMKSGLGNPTGSAIATFSATVPGGNPQGRWINMEIVLKPSRTTTGYIMAKADGLQFFEQTGQNMDTVDAGGRTTAGCQCYFKIGVYKGAGGIHTTHYDNVVVTRVS